MGADIDPRHTGGWSSNSRELYDARGAVTLGGHPRAANFAIWWDGDRTRELLDGKRITKWGWRAGRKAFLLDLQDVMSNNDTKQNPALITTTNRQTDGSSHARRVPASGRGRRHARSSRICRLSATTS